MPYAELNDLERIGVPPDINTVIQSEPDRVQTALETASGIIDGYISTRYVLPLAVFGDDFREACVALAAWNLGISTGLGIDGDNSSAYLRAQHARKWLEGVGAGRINPAGVTDSTPTPTPNDLAPTTGASVKSNPPRGW